MDYHIILKGITNRIQGIKETGRQRFDDELDILQGQYNLYINLSRQNKNILNKCIDNTF